MPVTGKSLLVYCPEYLCLSPLKNCQNGGNWIEQTKLGCTRWTVVDTEQVISLRDRTRPSYLKRQEKYSASRFDEKMGKNDADS